MNKTDRRGRPRVPVYAYSKDGIKMHFDSIREAAQHFGEHKVTCRNCLMDERVSIKGFFYSKKDLTPQEVQEIYKKHEEKQLAPSQNKQEYFANYSEFHLDRAKEDRKKALREFIYSKLNKRWLTCEKKIAEMEQKYLRVLIDSL